MTHWISKTLVVAASVGACEPSQSRLQVEHLIALGGNPEQNVVFYKCRDPGTTLARATPRRRAEQCYLKEPEGFAVLKWDRSGRLERVERAWDFGKDTTTKARRRWAQLRDSLVGALSAGGAVSTCTAPIDSAAWFQLWGWRFEHADVLVLAVSDTMGLSVGLTASAVPLTTCWDVQRPAA